MKTTLITYTLLDFIFKNIYIINLISHKVITT
jgi:hypothetical protein